MNSDDGGSRNAARERHTAQPSRGARTDAAALVASTGSAAFVTDRRSEIVAWNRDAERLFGYPAAQVIGTQCCALLVGTDSFGNRFCDAHCAPQRMRRRGEPIHPFEVAMRVAGGSVVRVRVTVLVLSGTTAGEGALLHVITPVTAKHEPAAGAPASGLSRRELEVLRLLAAGKSTEAIGCELYIAVNTVRNHIQRICTKLGARTRLAAVAVARRRGLV